MSRLKNIGSKEIEVDGVFYEFGCLKTSTSLMVWTWLCKIISPPLMELTASSLPKILEGLGSDNKEDREAILNAQIDSDRILEVVKDAVLKLDEPEVAKNIERLIESVRHNSHPINFETHFKGKLLHLMKVVVIAVQMNYSDFLGELSGRLSTEQRETNSGPPIQQSTGGSGESLAQGMAH